MIQANATKSEIRWFRFRCLSALIIHKRKMLHQLFIMTVKMVFNHDLAADMLSHGANAGDVGLILACVLF